MYIHVCIYIYIYIYIYLRERERGWSRSPRLEPRGWRNRLHSARTSRQEAFSAEGRRTLRGVRQLISPSAARPIVFGVGRGFFDCHCCISLSLSLFVSLYVCIYINIYLYLYIHTTHIYIYIYVIDMFISPLCYVTCRARAHACV